MNTKILLMLIIIIAALTRILFLGQFPNGFTGDEAQQGYSAYSILKTGHDEWGQLLPIFPRGFGDFKPPLYTYLTVPSIVIFGLTPEATRLPAAIVGILAILVIFYLTREQFSEKVAIWTSFLLAINPWHIQLSRTAFEGGLGVLTFSLGLLFFLKSKRKDLLLAAFFWGLTLYTYHSWRVFIILFIIGLLIIRRKFITKKLVTEHLMVGVILLIFTLPLVFNINSILARSSDVGISSSNQIKSFFENKGTSSLPSAIDKIFDNKYLFVKNIFLENYFSYFSPEFFFTGARSDSSYLNFPGFGLVYLIELVFFIFAFKRINRMLLLWFLLAPIPASLAMGGGSAGRAPTFLPLLSLISGLGAVEFINWIKNKGFKEKNVVALVVVILLISFVYFLHFYFVKLPQKPFFNLRYGYDQVFKKAIAVKNDYENIVFSKTFTEPQIFVGFYGKVDPKVYQAASKDWLRYTDAKRSYIDQLESWNLGKFLFEDLNWGKKESQRENSLIISKPEDFPKDVESILDVKDPKGKIFYRLVPVNHEI